MTGIVATLKARNSGRPVCQQVNDLALALVTPLGADDNYVFTHAKSLCLLIILAGRMNSALQGFPVVLHFVGPNSFGLTPV
jgi:hypothetical protein